MGGLCTSLTGFAALVVSIEVARIAEGAPSPASELDRPVLDLESGLELPSELDATLTEAGASWFIFQDFLVIRRDGTGFATAKSAVKDGGGVGSCFSLSFGENMGAGSTKEKVRR